MVVTGAKRTVRTVVDVDLALAVFIDVGLDIGIVTTEAATEPEVSTFRLAGHHVVVITLILGEVVCAMRIELTVLT